MTRHLRATVLVAAALVAGGATLPAFAGVPQSTEDGRHEVCVGGQSDPNGPLEGICVWVPTK